MATLGFIEYADAPPEVKAVYDDIMISRQTDYINNFWKALAHDPATLRRTWQTAKEVMGPGSLDPLTKELIYTAITRGRKKVFVVGEPAAWSMAVRNAESKFRHTHLRQKILGA